MFLAEFVDESAFPKPSEYKRKFVFWLKSALQLLQPRKKGFRSVRAGQETSESLSKRGFRRTRENHVEMILPM